MLGVLTYIFTDEDAKKILDNLFEHIKPGGYLVTKDTLNCEGMEALYLLNKKTGYTAIYRQESSYYKLFFDAGFKLKEDRVLDEVNSRKLLFASKGCIWEKEEK